MITKKLIIDKLTVQQYQNYQNDYVLFIPNLFIEGLELLPLENHCRHQDEDKNHNGVDASYA